MMAVPKRTRFEVLRRDSHTCRYCGASAPDVKLHVDHVMPVALGGNDDPSNLVAACVDCNNGKASTSPESATVDAVSDDAIRWAAAIKEAARRAEERTEEEQEYVNGFYDVWCSYAITGTDRTLPLSPNWATILLNYRRSGLTGIGVTESIEATMSRRGIEPGSRFPYFCGVVRNKLQALNEAAAQLIEDGEV